MSMCTEYKLFYWKQSLKPHTALLVVCLLGPKLGDDVVSLSQLNAGSTFSYGEIFHKTFFFHQNPGVFSAILLLSLYWCQVREASLALFPVSSGLPRALFDSTVYILCCVLENVRVGGQSSR